MTCKQFFPLNGKQNRSPLGNVVVLFLRTRNPERSWSINSSTPSALHDVIVWNTTDKNCKTVTLGITERSISLQCLCSLVRSPRFLYSRLSSPTVLSIFSYERYSTILVIFEALFQALSRLSLPFTGKPLTRYRTSGVPSLDLNRREDSPHLI